MEHTCCFSGKKEGSYGVQSLITEQSHIDAASSGLDIKGPAGYSGITSLKVNESRKRSAEAFFEGYCKDFQIGGNSPNNETTSINE